MRRLAILLAAAIVASLAPLVPLAPVVPGCAAAGSGHAALVVEHDGSVVTRCIALNQATISGEELLNQSGVAWSSQAFGGFGVAVCAIDGEPAQYVDCLGKDYYWALFVSRDGGPWQLSSAGISSLTLGNGDAEGFRYVPGAGVAAPPVSASGVCPTAATLTPAPTVAAIATARPTAGPTPTPLATSTTAEAPATEAPTAASPTATASPVAKATATIAPSPPPSVPNQTPPGGADPGLILAVGVGGGLAGLAILRSVFARQSGP